MCTVTYVKNENITILTSNRDEAISRPAALYPQTYVVNGKKIIFPKDTKANGTWFAVSEEGSVAIVLNGADKKHVSKGPYRRSRGLILLDILSAANPVEAKETIDLDNIEPFTLILYTGSVLYQFRWDGNKKETVELDPEANHIWASATLYSEEVRAKRNELFKDYLTIHETPTPEEMLFFHEFTEGNDKENGLVINRNDFLKTVSITQCVIENNRVYINYNDLISHNINKESILIL
ncbi:NRDE family protein [Flavobacterium sp. NRK1]|uniref:NRDE family protein n=1 Tax=Flavobacterium sp. NRK1 TaxID=2954929 RepID=UPI002092EAE0|nr:NRDE family protein [Flavobacterium sp. NRK1]MCO6146657.1 NRDE family protein [Flavobacterium sp. NRK1]